MDSLSSTQKIVSTTTTNTQTEGETTTVESQADNSVNKSDAGSDTNNDNNNNHNKTDHNNDSQNSKSESSNVSNGTPGGEVLFDDLVHTIGTFCATINDLLSMLLVCTVWHSAIMYEPRVQGDNLNDTNDRNDRNDTNDTNGNTVNTENVIENNLELRRSQSGDNVVKNRYRLWMNLLLSNMKQIVPLSLDRTGKSKHHIARMHTIMLSFDASKNTKEKQSLTTINNNNNNNNNNTNSIVSVATTGTTSTPSLVVGTSVGASVATRSVGTQINASVSVSGGLLLRKDNENVKKLDDIILIHALSQLGKYSEKIENCLRIICEKFDNYESKRNNDESMIVLETINEENEILLLKENGIVELFEQDCNADSNSLTLFPCIFDEQKKQEDGIQKISKRNNKDIMESNLGLFTKNIGNNISHIVHIIINFDFYLNQLNSINKKNTNKKISQKKYKGGNECEGQEISISEWKCVKYVCLLRVLMKMLLYTQSRVIFKWFLYQIDRKTSVFLNDDPLAHFTNKMTLNDLKKNRKFSSLIDIWKIKSCEARQSQIFYQNLIDFNTSIKQNLITKNNENIKIKNIDIDGKEQRTFRTILQRYENIGIDLQEVYARGCASEAAWMSNGMLICNPDM